MFERIFVYITTNISYFNHFILLTLLSTPWLNNMFTTRVASKTLQCTDLSIISSSSILSFFCFYFYLSKLFFFAFVLYLFLRNLFDSQLHSYILTILLRFYPILIYHCAHHHILYFISFIPSFLCSFVLTFQVTTRLRTSRRKRQIRTTRRRSPW